MNRGLLLVIGLSGCISIKPYPEPSCQAGSGGHTCEGVLVSQDDSGTRATGPTWDVHFTPNAFGYPDTIAIAGGDNVLATGSPLCSDEDQVGVALFPAFRASASTPQQPTDAKVVVDFSGPDVGKVTVDWHAQHDCSGTSRFATGHSTFTFFIDGRVVRHDHVTDTGPALSASSCQCPGGSSSATWMVASFATLRWPSEGTDGVSLPTDTGAGVVSSGQSVCAGVDSKAFAIGTFAGPIRARSPDLGRSLALVFDMTPSPPSTLPTTDVTDARTTWYLANTSCPVARAQLDRYLADIQLEIDPMGSGYTPIGRALDGVYGGEDTAAGGFPADDTVKLRAMGADIPLGAAVWLKFSGGARSTFTLTHQLGGEVKFSYQMLAQDEVIFYFNEPITNADPITLTAAP